MLLHVIRHGDPDYATDSLTERGRQEAAALGERLAAMDDPPTALFSSPMGRARETARAASDRLGMDVEVLEWAAELSSPVVDDGTGRTDLAFWNVAGEYVHDPAQKLLAWNEFPIYADPEVRDRMTREIERVHRGSDQFLESLGLRRDGGAYRVCGDLPASVAMFCHGGLGATWIAHLIGIPTAHGWAAFSLATTSITTICFDQRSPGRAVPRISTLGDIAHLAGRGLSVPGTTTTTGGQPS